jgi:CAAX protease family protein
MVDANAPLHSRPLHSVLALAATIPFCLFCGIFISPFIWQGLGAVMDPPAFNRVLSRITVLSFVLSLFLLRKRIGYLPRLKDMLQYGNQSRSQLAHGIICALVPLLLLTPILIILDIWRWDIEPFSRIATKLPTYLISAALIAVFEEILSRGIIMGTLLQRLRPFYAILISSAFFAAVHPLNSPDGSPTIFHPLMGFESLSQFGAIFSDPRTLSKLVGYFLVGIILALGTVRTGRLYLAMGLHFGWVLFIKADGFWISRDSAFKFFFGGGRLVDGACIWLLLAALIIYIGRVKRHV